MATLYAVILGPVQEKPGWYWAFCHSFGQSVKGVSIKGTTLSAGQRVAVVQSGSWTDPRRTFGFAEISAGILSHIELSATKAWTIETNPIGAALAGLLHKAGKAQEIYRPARVTAVGLNTLTVTDWYTGQPVGSWRVASGLKIADFAVNDGVLLRLLPSASMRVEGWWETFPQASGPYMVGVRASFHGMARSTYHKIHYYLRSGYAKAVAADGEFGVLFDYPAGTEITSVSTGDLGIGWVTNLQLWVQGGSGTAYRALRRDTQAPIYSFSHLDSTIFHQETTSSISTNDRYFIEIDGVEAWPLIVLFSPDVARVEPTPELTWGSGGAIAAGLKGTA